MSHRFNAASADDDKARVRADVLAECYPLSIAHVLCDVVPVEGLLWQCLPAAWRETTCNLLLSSGNEWRMFGDRSFYAMLVLATPTLDDAERRDEFLLPIKRCAESRRHLVAMLRENEKAIDAIINTVTVDAAAYGLTPDDMPAYTAFQMMLVAATKSTDYDAGALQSICAALLRSIGLPDDSIKEHVINGKALAFEARFSHLIKTPQHHEVAPAGTVLH